MRMHNPPHPGEFITELYLEPFGISGRELAEKLDVAPSTLSRLLKGSSRVTPEMALRLSKALGRSPETGWPCRTPMICGWHASTPAWNAWASSCWHWREPLFHQKP